MSAFQICREHRGEWKGKETLRFYEKEKRNIEKYAALIVLSYEQRRVEEHSRSLESTCLCILLI